MKRLNRRELREALVVIANQSVPRAEDFKPVIEHCASLEAELAEYDRVFNLQQTRMAEADMLWRKANPGNEGVRPDLGKLLSWLMSQIPASNMPDPDTCRDSGAPLPGSTMNDLVSKIKSDRIKLLEDTGREFIEVVCDSEPDIRRLIFFYVERQLVGGYTWRGWQKELDAFRDALNIVWKPFK